MDIHNTITVIVGIITILGAVYKLAQVESNINTKIASIETKGFLIVENLKDKVGERITTVDRKLDVHLQDFVNYKDAILLQGKGLDEKINHTWSKTKELLNEQKTEIKDIQASLKIRD
ncbi:hypothetical protein [Nostoc sp.]|uniref:hypothetical protein n=1 Tax=Nostoc sp. TaxID=1180 RepID=UPI002FF83997